MLLSKRDYFFLNFIILIIFKPIFLLYITYMLVWSYKMISCPKFVSVGHFFPKWRPFSERCCLLRMGLFFQEDTCRKSWFLLKKSACFGWRYNVNGIRILIHFICVKLAVTKQWSYVNSLNFKLKPIIFNH